MLQNYPRHPISPTLGLLATGTKFCSSYVIVESRLVIKSKLKMNNIISIASISEDNLNSMLIIRELSFDSKGVLSWDVLVMTC